MGSRFAARKLMVWHHWLRPFAPGLTSAQTFRGTIRGAGVDNTKAVAPGVDISVKDTETGLTRSTVTDSIGNFTQPELPIGTFESTARLPGFQMASTPRPARETASCPLP